MRPRNFPRMHPSRNNNAFLLAIKLFGFAGVNKKIVIIKILLFFCDSFFGCDGYHFDWPSFESVDNGGFMKIDILIISDSLADGL